MEKKKDQQENEESKDPIKNFDIRINEFGEITTNLEIDKVNDFLNENVDDKKLRDVNPDSQEEEQ